MSKKTSIAWTDATFNPWWGCTRISPGCEHCYAESFTHRYGFDLWGKNTKRRIFGDKHWAEPLKWNEAAKESGKPFRVFCASMADVFEDHPDVLPARMDLFNLVEVTKSLTWLILTKRPENFKRMTPTTWHILWPSNAWVMVTAENQEQYNKRVPYLFEVNAVVRGVSYEPAIGPLDIGLSPAYIDWIICGGESGGGARPMDVQWARKVRDQCQSAGISFFMKQMGGRQNKRDRLLDLPDDLRIRQWPNTRVAA